MREWWRLSGSDSVAAIVVKEMHSPLRTLPLLNYFLSPTPMRTVTLGKNLFHSVAFALSLAIGAILAVLRLGRPDGVVVAWLVFGLPCNLSAGNIFSLNMPNRVNPARISRHRGSRVGTLLGLLVGAGMMGVGAAIFAPSSYLGMLWLAVPVFLGLTRVMAFVWLWILGDSDRIANQRKDLLIATLVKTE